MRKLQANTPEQIQHAIQQASEVLAQGGLVIFPTETVYGLAADALSEGAVRRVWEAGVRAVLVGSALVRSPDPARKLRELLNAVSTEGGRRWDR
ncbi:MAG: hypothetical protein C4336_02425 [Armatimonadota bacterium]